VYSLIRPPNPGADGLEYGVERAGKVRSAVADQESHVPEPGPVSRLVPHPAGVPPQDRVLMPENQQLSILRQVAAEHQDGQAECPAREQVDDLEQHPAS